MGIAASASLRAFATPARRSRAIRAASCASTFASAAPSPTLSVNFQPESDPPSAPPAAATSVSRAPSRAFTARARSALGLSSRRASLSRSVLHAAKPSPPS